MSLQIWIVLSLNFIVSLIGTLAYSVRLVGIRTGKISVSFAVFNVFALVSRVAVTLQLPLLTKFVEQGSDSDQLLNVFMLVILVSGTATLIGAFMIPTFQRFFTRLVTVFSVKKTIPKLLMHSLSNAGIRHIREYTAIPVKENITKLLFKNLQISSIILNVIAVALITTGALAPIYAGYIEPDFRATCITLAPIITGIATILLTVFVDPQLSVMTDEVIEGKCSEQKFRSNVVGMVCSKTIGTFLSLPLFLPATIIITHIAKWI
jgi:hypothetical protein